MFGIDSSELAVIALVALLVIGPKDLPRVMRMVGNWIAKGRAMTRHVRAGFDTMMREAELEEMQKAWAAQNEAIMKATSLPDLLPDPMAGINPSSWALPDPQSIDVGAEPAGFEAAPAPVSPPDAHSPAGDVAIKPPPKTRKPRGPRAAKAPVVDA